MSWKSQLLRPHADPKNKPQHLTTRPVWQWQERQTHQNGDSSPERVDKYCQQIFGDVWNLYTLFTRFCLLFLAYTFIESIYIYIDCFICQPQACEQSCIWIESQVVSPTARWHPMLPVTAPATLVWNLWNWSPTHVMEPSGQNLEILPNLSQLLRIFEAFELSKAFQKQGQTHISNPPCHEETSETPLEPLYPKPSKLGNLPFYSTTTCLNHHLPTIPVFQPHPGLDVDHKAQEGTQEFTKHQVGLHRSQETVGEGNCLALNRLAMSGYNIMCCVCVFVFVCLVSDLLGFCTS